jgi:hypothetical protein
MVAEALAGVKLSLVEIGVFQAAGELQRLQKGMGTFKKAMTQIVESESTSQTRRATGKLLYSKKKEEVNEMADVELLAAHGLISQEGADEWSWKGLANKPALRRRSSLSGKRGAKN